jgi:hypothetical protein
MAVKYIILHWTGGNYKPCKLDLASYQLLIDGEGEIHEGKPQGTTNSVGGMNSITYNIACCGGLDRTPMTKIQCEKLFKTCAEKLKEYKLTVDKVYTHAEIGKMCLKGSIARLLFWNEYLKQNIGKIDLTEIPYDLEGLNTGDFIRNKIEWYFNKIN